MCLTKLDVGLTARPAMPADVQAVTDLMNVCLQLDLGRAPLDVSMLQTDWANPYRKPETTIRLVFAGDLLVGYAGAWIEPPAVVVYGGIYVHPDYRARGIGEYLAAWLKDLVVSAAFPLAPDDAKVVLHMERPETDSYTRTLLLGAGYRIVRYGLRMLIALDSAPPAPIFPEGIEIRTFNRVRDLPAVVRAEQDIFRDHWGYVQQDFEQDLADWENWIDNNMHHKPELWFVAVERGNLSGNGEGAIAGICLCNDHMPEDPGMVYVESLGVQRAWRRQGLGLAMLHHAFGVVRERGKTSVSLDVDAASLTGATRLYEKAGMHIQRKLVIYELLLREGRDLSTQDLEESE